MSTPSARAPRSPAARGEGGHRQRGDPQVQAPRAAGPGPRRARPGPRPRGGDPPAGGARRGRRATRGAATSTCSRRPGPLAHRRAPVAAVGSHWRAPISAAPPSRPGGRGDETGAAGTGARTRQVPRQAGRPGEPGGEAQVARAREELSAPGNAKREGRRGPRPARQRHDRRRAPTASTTPRRSDGRGSRRTAAARRGRRPLPPARRPPGRRPAVRARSRVPKAAQRQWPTANSL